MKRSIWVTFQKAGIHRYPEALMDPALEKVRYIGYEHRHIFHFRVDIEVFHEDRDVEFILFKQWLESLYQDSTLALDFKSCEMMASDLYDIIHGKYPNRAVTIEVSEDGENGCHMEWDA